MIHSSVAIYANANKSSMIFDMEWRAGLARLVETGVRYEPVAVFRVKAFVEARWLREGEDQFWLHIGQSIYAAADVMGGEADEHIEKLWSAWDE